VNMDFLTKPNIAVMGYLCLDLYPDLSENRAWKWEPGMLREVGSCAGLPGGAVGNTGLALHRLGIPVRLAARIGDDLFGRTLTECFHRALPGPAIHLKTGADSSTGYSIVLNPPGQDRMFLVHRGSNDALTAGDAAEDLLDGAALLHFGYPPLCRRFAENGGAELRELFRNAHRRGIVTSLDMSLPAPGSFSAALDWPEYLRRVLPETDLFLPSIDELTLMLKPTEKEPVLRLRQMADRLLGYGAAVVVIKLGKNGLYLKTTGGARRLKTLEPLLGGNTESWRDREYLAPCRSVRVAGTTGAGDAAIAGFLAGAVTGASAAEAARLAVGTGADSVTRTDSVSGIRPLADVRRRLEQGWEKNPLEFASGTISLL